MKYKSFFVITLFLGTIGYSKENNTFSCNTVVYGFINGINYKKISDNKISGLLISKFLKIKEVEPIFNQSQGVSEDIKRSIIQKIDEKLEENTSSGYFNRLKLKSFKKTIESKQDNKDSISERILNLKKINKGSLIVFSHSQGNLYANEACTQLGKGSFHNIQIATPADKIKCSDFLSYTSIYSDEMIVLTNSAEVTALGIKNLELNPPLKANRPQHREPGDFLVHSMENYLLNPPSLMKIKNDHEDMIQKLNYEKPVVKLKDKEEINCKNIENFVDKNIDINKDQTGFILGRTVKFASYDSIEIDRIDDDSNLYQVSKFNRYSWIEKIYKFIATILILVFLPSILYFMGSIMTTMGDSDKEQREKEKDRYL